MKRIVTLLLLITGPVFFAIAQPADSVAMEQKLKEMELKLQEMETRLKEIDQNAPPPPAAPVPPGAPRRQRKVIVIEREGADSLVINTDEISVRVEREMEDLRRNLDSSLRDADPEEIRREVEKEIENLRRELEEDFGHQGDIRYYENDDSLVVRLGDLRIKIDEEKNERIVIDADEDPKPEEKKQRTVEPTFAGLRLGLNNYIYGNRIGATPVLHPELELITGKSIHVNIGLVGVKIRMASENVTLHTGFAIDVNNYRFRSDSVLKPKVDQVAFYSRSEEGDVTKNKLTATYLELPVKLQIATGKGGAGAFKFALGFRAAYLLGAHTKVKVNDEKEKVRDDFNLTTLKYGPFLQIGVGWFNFYANYDLSPVFRDGVKPELQPVAAGIVLTGW